MFHRAAAGGASAFDSLQARILQACVLAWVLAIVCRERFAFGWSGFVCAWPTLEGAGASSGGRAGGEMSSASPYTSSPPVHVAVIADPQLTDLTSYSFAKKGSLSLAAIERLSDVYMARAFRHAVLPKAGGLLRTRTRLSSCSDESNRRVCMNIHPKDRRLSSYGHVRSRFECLLLSTTRPCCEAPRHVLFLGDLLDGGHNTRDGADWERARRRFDRIFRWPRDGTGTGTGTGGGGGAGSYSGGGDKAAMAAASAAAARPSYHTIHGNHDVGRAAASQHTCI